MENIEWLKSVMRFVKVRGIEVDLGMKVGTVDKFLRGKRGLSEKNRLLLDEYVGRMRYGFIGDVVPIKKKDIVEKPMEGEIVPKGFNVTEILNQKKDYKNMKRVEANINSNGEIFEVFYFKEGKFNWCYAESIESAREKLELMKKHL